MGILDNLFGKKRGVNEPRQDTSSKQSPKADSAAIPPQTVFIPEKESGAIFIFNHGRALSTQANPQRYFSQSILRAFCPRESNCPRHIQEAFYELRVSSIDRLTWMKRFY